MSDRPRLNQGGYDYTTEPTRYRIIKEDQGDEWPWMLDGIDDERNYTEDVRFFSTWQEAVDALPEFAEQNPLAWFGACGIAHCGECLPRYDHRNRPILTQERLYCWKCNRPTIWTENICEGCRRTWGVAPTTTEPEPNVYEVVVGLDGDGWTAALFPVTGGARDSMIETGSGPTPRQALIDLTFTWARD